MLASVAAALVCAANSNALAGHGCCDCGCGDGVRKVCRVVPDKRKIQKNVYACECADICIAGKSCRGCLQCDEVCGEGKACDCCSHRPHALLRWFNWEPGCAHVKTVKKLTLYTASKEVCGWKWQIVDVCENCCPSGNCVPADDGTPVQKAPVGASADEIPMPPVPVKAAAYLQPAAGK
jgi:hypothetical protein